MLNMTQSELPKFAFPSSEDIKTATERLTYLWVGACSPMWVPFFAATSFGVSAWMMSGAAARGSAGGDLYKDLPKGFVDMMSLRHSLYKAGEEAAHVLEDVNEVVREATVTPVMMAIEAEDAVVDALTEPAPEAVSESVPVPETLTEPQVAAVPEAAPAPAVVRAAPKRRPAPKK